ncbi:MAG: phenylphosphate carboxylase subunit beta [Dehalococcoidia bacterium]
MKDLRGWIEACEKEGELKRIKPEVDWNLELSHIATLNERRRGPALLFENVKDYDIPVLTSAFTTPKKLAITLGLPLDYSMCDLAREWMKRTTKGPTKPVEVKNGPVTEQVIERNNVNLFDFPAPFLYPQDGGRYIGTSAFLVTKDPETGWTNLGTYRMQVLDETSTGVQIIKGKHADFHRAKYEKMGKKMPAAAVIGCHPLYFLVASSMVSAEMDEYDIIGSLFGEPVEVFESDLTGLKLPAGAGIILEGEIDPVNFRPEGPFGEYTGYYSGKAKGELPKPWLDVKRVLRQKNPVFQMTTVGKPLTDQHMIQSLNRTGTLWSDLETMRVPGIQSVYIPPESTGRFWAIVSVKTMYPGHANHVGNAVISTTTGHYGLKGVIVVDADVPADDMGGVWWSLAVRYNAVQDSEIIKRGRSTPLDPSLPMDAREIVSRIIMDATIPYEWKEKPQLIELDPDVLKRVESRWSELGL